MSAIDPWAEIARLQKELDAAVTYHDECGELIESALGSDARKYNEGGALFEHYASDIRRIRLERDQARGRETLDLPLSCPNCKTSIAGV